MPLTACLDPSTLGLMVGGGALVVGGVAAIDGYKQGPLGTALFIAGWVLITIAMVGRVGGAIVIAAATVVLTAILMQMALARGEKPLLPALAFAAGWAAIGVAAGSRAGKQAGAAGPWNGGIAVGLAVPALVLTSMMVVLPLERTRTITYGLGMPLFVGAWGLLALLVSFDGAGISGVTPDMRRIGARVESVLGDGKVPAREIRGAISALGVAFEPEVQSVEHAATQFVAAHAGRNGGPLKGARRIAARRASMDAGAYDTM